MSNVTSVDSRGNRPSRGMMISLKEEERDKERGQNLAAGEDMCVEQRIHRRRTKRHREPGTMEGRPVRCRDQTWEGFGVCPRGYWKSQKAFKLNG